MEKVRDFVVIGSGFGGSVSAMRLVEKGYDVLVLERGKRWKDEDFPKTNWNVFKFIWRPALRMFGLLQIDLLKDVMVLHGSGVGGGSLIYANVLMEPEDHLFDAPGWREFNDWREVLRPHYATAKRMLGVTPNPRFWAADHVLKEIAKDYGQEDSFRATNVAIYFGDPKKAGQTVPDPFFGGAGPDRAGCTHCGGCMVGCRHNAKNTLTKNYLYFAEKHGGEIRAEAKVVDIRPLPEGQADGARYEVLYRHSLAQPWDKRTQTVRTRNVIVSAHVMGTLKLLFNCRDVHQSLPKLSQRLGDNVRTNSETIPGSTRRTDDVDYSKGVAITSIFRVDDNTHLEPVRYPAGSGFIRMLAMPMIGSGNFVLQVLRMLWYLITRPLDFMHSRVFGKWAERTTILLIMQTADTTMKMRLGRHLFTGFQRGLVSKLNPGQRIAPPFEISHGLTKKFAEKTNGVAQDSIPEALLGIPTTAHLLGGVPMGRSAEDGVIDKYCEVFNYPGLYVVDGSIMPANPGINPSLTITALAEYAMSHIPAKASQPDKEPDLEISMA